jgi:ATP-binding cassette subfamily F protein uup
MAAQPRNLVNLQNVSRSFASRPVLTDVSLGVGAGERIGVVGRNGDGKSTLLRLLAGVDEPDSGEVTRTGGVHLALVGQGDELDGARSIREQLVGDRAEHEWAGDSRFRSVLDGLLGGVDLGRFPQGMDTLVGPLSGGERRRIALAKLLLDSQDLLLLDEPTNHLDLEAVDWLARHLRTRRGAMVVITHDRWFLDAVVERTWEVADQSVHSYEGGYAAWVLARAERERQAAARDARRRNLLRKELAWLRRGPPARTSKPKFRTDAANALIADEPPARDTAELLRFAAARLGDKVLDCVDVSVRFGDRRLLNGVTWRLGPGDRVGLVGVNGSGKTTLVKVLTGEVEPTSGGVERGATVRLAHLSQDTAEVPGHLRVLEALEEVRTTATTSDGSEVSAGKLCDRFGFRGSRAGTLVRDLSGGERRRLQLMRLLMAEPNVLVMDEPTNDLDIDTLTALEDLLDGWPGTLVVVSHDRYFVERVCDNVYAIDAGGGLRHLPGGIEQYIEQRRAAEDVATDSTGSAVRSSDTGTDTQGSASAPALSGGEARAARKDLARIERALERLEPKEAQLHEQMATAATDHTRLRELTAELDELHAERSRLEGEWMVTSELLEG